MLRLYPPWGLWGRGLDCWRMLWFGLGFGSTVILCWSWRTNQLMFPDFLSGFWPRKEIPWLSICAWNKENCNKCVEQKELKHHKRRVRGTEPGGPCCTSMNAEPRCLLRHCLRGQGSMWETIIATMCSLSHLDTLFQGPVVGLGVLFFVTKCCCSAMVEHSSWLTPAEVFQALWFPNWLHRSNLGCCASWHKVC